MIIARLLACRKGATIVEFALLAPAFLTVLFGIIEGSRLLWTQQTLDEVAFSTARCMSVDAGCSTASGRTDYAVARATAYGIAISGAAVSTNANATCKGFANSSEVTISHTFNSPATGLIPGLGGDLQISACYPSLSGA